jgi:bifunctional DNase/RNase
MHVAGIALDAASRSPIVLLRDPAGRRQVPIWIDQAQAHNIMAGLQGEPTPRPLSHDLMVALLEAGGLELKRVIIHAIEDNTFRAVLRLEASIPVDADADHEEQDAFRRFLDQVSPAALVRHLESRRPDNDSAPNESLDP